MTKLIEDFTKRVAGSISSISALANALDLNLSEIENLLNTPADQRYKEKFIEKKHGGVRKVYNPSALVRKIQQRIINRIFKPLVDWPFFVYGSIPKSNGQPAKDYVAAANVHAGAGSLLKMDIKDFFDNIQREVVFDVFFDFFKYPYPVSEVLTDICCRDDRLCQGALTSSYLAALCIFDVEARMVKRIEKKGVTYTRYVDDITISSKNRSYDFSYVEKVVEEVLMSKDLPVNKGKTSVVNLTSKPLLVHGLRVNTSNARLPIAEVKRIRAAVQHLEVASREPNYITLPTYREEFNKCMGRVNKLARVGHIQHSALVSRLKRIRPKSTRSDLYVAIQMLKIIRRTSQQRRQHYFFKKQCAQAKTLLTLIKKNNKYSRRAAILLNYLRKI